MANTRFQHKRSSVSGVVPTTSDIATGELGINLADRRLFTSNGTAVVELGSNLTSLAVGNSTVRQVVNTTGAFVNGNISLSRNDTRLTFTPTAGGANVYFALQSDDNFVFYTTNTTGGTKAVFNVYANTNSPNQNSAFRFNVSLDMGTQGLYANNGLGSSGQVLTSNGSGVYWSTSSSGTVTNIATGSGLTGGPITTTGTVSVLANNGITTNSTGLFVTQGTGTVVNATGVHVNATYIGTLSANNSTNLNGQPASSYTNATNITTGTLDNARLPSAINVTSVNAATLSVGTDFVANSSLTRSAPTLGVPGTSGEGGQIVLGFGNSLATAITGQANNTYNIDVIGGTAGFTPQLRIFTQNGDGTATAILNASNTGRVHIGSLTEQTDSTFKVTGTANITANAAVGGALTAANVTATVFTGALTGTASNATNLNSQPGSFYTNATNITTGTLPWAQAPSGTVNTSGAFTITGIYTHSANVVMGNTTVNTQLSNATILISNSTSTTTLGLTDLRIGNTSTNVVIANTVSSFGGNVSIAGVANVTGNVTLGAAAFFVGNGVNITTVNATNITTGTLPNARLAAEVVNTSANFTIAGIHTHTVNVHMGSTTVNTQQSNAIIVINNSNTATLNASSISFGNTTVNAVYGLATITINGAGIANSTGANNAFNLGGVAAASYQTTAGLSANVATLTANNATNLGGVAAASYQLNSTLAANVATLTANNATNLGGQAASFYTNATNLATGTVPTARLGSGTANSSTFLRGDQTWAVAGGSLAGGELFNINVSNATGYAVTTSMAAAFTAPATAGLEYIVHSIQVTNIGTANAAISGELSGTTYSNISFALTVPVPRESAVELLKMPKVLQPSDILRLQSDVASTLHAYITVETVTSTAYFGAGVDITSDATFVDLHTAAGNSVITSVLLSNDDGVNDVRARVVWTDSLNTIQGYLCFDLIIPADSTVELLEKVKFLPNGHKIRVYANVGGRLEAVIAGKVL